MKTEYLGISQQLANHKSHPAKITALTENIKRYREEDRHYQGELLTQFRRVQESFDKRLRELEGETKRRKGKERMARKKPTQGNSSPEGPSPKTLTTQVQPEGDRTYAQVAVNNTSQRSKSRDPIKRASTNLRVQQKAPIDAIQIEKEGKTPEEVQKELEDEFNPEEKGWNVVNVRRGKKSVVLKVDRETEAKIRTDPDLKDKGFKVRDTRTRRPRIAVLAVPTESTYAQITQHMHEVIGNLEEEETPKKLTWITEKYNRYRSSKTVILEVEPYIRQKLMEKGN